MSFKSTTPINDYIRSMVKKSRLKEFNNSPQITVSQLVQQVKEFPSNAKVRFDFGGVPYGFHSYRGFYDELAVGWVSDSKTNLTIEDFLVLLKQCMGTSFTGYKGGDFIMYADTPVWASLYGDVSDLMITGVKPSSADSDNGITEVTIITEKYEMQEL